jgi:hypothetical protein
MRVLFYCILIVIFYSCSDKPNRLSYKEIEKDGYIIKGNVIDDSVFNDTMRYYDRNNILISKKVFVNGTQSGVSFDYYPNGYVWIASNYSINTKNGKYLVFDSTGKLQFESYYYFDLGVGPVIYYKNNDPERYFFISLDDRDLLRIDYSDWRGISGIFDQLVNFSVNETRRDTVNELSVFLYLINPPKLSVVYSVDKANRIDDSKKAFVRSINSDGMFIRFSLPKLSDQAEKYVFKLEVFDSILNKKSIIYRDIN